MSDPNALTAAECDRFEAEMWAAERMRPGALPMSAADADALDEARGRLGAERLLKAIDAHTAAWEAAGWVRRAWWRVTRGGPEV